MSANDLPPLPPTVYGLFYKAPGDDECWQEFMDVPGFTAGHMQAYARAAVEAEREACAKVAISEKVDADATGDPSDAAYNVACEHIAAAIRERGKS